jgi:SAM-dependent methyltransferase
MRMRLRGWNETDLDLAGQDIAAAFEPFIGRRVAAADADWVRDVRGRKWKIFRRYLLRQLLRWLPGQGRNTAAVIAEYDEVWRAGHGKYCVGPLPWTSPWIWREQRLYANAIGGPRFRHVILARVLEHLKPRSVLEVGCGDGINLILLACRFPEIEFTGIELTAEGHKAAIDFQSKFESLPLDLQTYAPLPLFDLAGFRRIRFVQGSAARLPFSAGAFDLVTTVLAIEQMEQIRDQALSEIARVARSHAFMIEPFRDVNARSWPRLNVVRRNYFQGRIDDLVRYGLKPEFAVDDYPQELFLRTCAVLARNLGEPSSESGQADNLSKSNAIRIASGGSH